MWPYPRERWSDERFALSPQHDVLREAIGEELDQLQLRANGAVPPTFGRLHR